MQGSDEGRRMREVAAQKAQVISSERYVWAKVLKGEKETNGNDEEEKGNRIRTLTRLGGSETKDE